MRTITRTVYDFDELSPAAKERARDWYREGQCQDQDWAESVIEDFERICPLLGIRLDTQTVPLMGGGTRQDPVVYYSLHVQGAGACFAGTYSYRKGSMKAIREYAPQDAVLQRIAAELAGVQRQYGYSLTARITTSSGQGPYSFVEVFNERNREVAPDDDRMVTDLLYNLMEWLYHALDREWTYQTSDKAIDEMIRINEYTFTEDGRRDG